MLKYRRAEVAYVGPAHKTIPLVCQAPGGLLEAGVWLQRGVACYKIWGLGTRLDMAIGSRRAREGCGPAAATTRPTAIAVADPMDPAQEKPSDVGLARPTE